MRKGREMIEEESKSLQPTNRHALLVILNDVFPCVVSSSSVSWLGFSGRVTGAAGLCRVEGWRLDRVAAALFTCHSSGARSFEETVLVDFIWLAVRIFHGRGDRGSAIGFVDRELPCCSTNLCCVVFLIILSRCHPTIAILICTGMCRRPVADHILQVLSIPLVLHPMEE